jgi:hypothetical protein
MTFLQWLSAEPSGQTTLQIGELCLALVLSSLIDCGR